MRGYSLAASFRYASGFDLQPSNSNRGHAPIGFGLAPAEAPEFSIGAEITGAGFVIGREDQANVLIGVWAMIRRTGS
jgi:hypothetical protein